MQQKLSFTKSLIYVNVSRALCALPSVSVVAVLGLCVNFCFEHSLSGACLLSLPLHRFTGMPLGPPASREGSRQMCTHTQAKMTWCIHLPDRPSFLGINTSHLPERVLESLGVIYLFIYYFFEYPIPKERASCVKTSVSAWEGIIALGGWAGALALVIPRSQLLKQEPRHFCLEEHTELPITTGYISPGSDRCSGQGLDRARQCILSFPTILGLQTSVSGNFKSTTSRMSKYLVTSLIMWIATELFLLCKTTKAICRYFSYKLM